MRFQEIKNNQSVIKELGPSNPQPGSQVPQPQQDPISYEDAKVKLPDGRIFQNSDKGWYEIDAKGNPTPGATYLSPTSAQADQLNKIFKNQGQQPRGFFGRLKDKFTKAIGGELATKTKADPDASSWKRAGATAGAGIGRAMGNLLRSKPQQATNPDGTGQAQQTQLKPVPGPTKAELKMLQTKTLQGDLNSAKMLVQKLSDLKQGGYDADVFIQSAAPAMKRGGLPKNDPQAYTHFTKLARSMRAEAYKHLCKILEHAGFTWEDVGYEVLISESISSHVLLIPIKEIKIYEMKKLAGM